MQEKRSGNPENQDANEESQAVIEVSADDVLRDLQRMVREAAGKPEGWGCNKVKAAINRSAHELGITAREAKAWWYRERGEPPHSYYMAVKARYAEWCAREARRNAAQKELLDARIAAHRQGKHADHQHLSREGMPVDRRQAR